MAIEKLKRFTTWLLLLAGCCILGCSPMDEVGRDAELLVAEVEKFEALNGRYPDQTREVRPAGPLDQGRGPFYELLAPNHYRVWYGKTLGESIVYDSRSGKWSRR